jgi:hypothetical protein
MHRSEAGKISRSGPAIRQRVQLRSATVARKHGRSKIRQIEASYRKSAALKFELLLPKKNPFMGRHLGQWLVQCGSGSLAVRVCVIFLMHE